MQDIRWKQRFENFEKAFLLLRSAFDKETELNDLEKEGVIQRFEYTTELAWKTLKDYLEFCGVKIEQITPKNVIKKAFEANIIKHGEIWIDMIAQRNLLSHVYSQITFNEAIAKIKGNYISILDDLMMFFKEKSIDELRTE